MDPYVLHNRIHMWLVFYFQLVCYIEISINLFFFINFYFQRWQRRWFVLYDDGELTYSVDEHVSILRCVKFQNIQTNDQRHDQRKLNKINLESKRSQILVNGIVFEAFAESKALVRYFPFNATLKKFRVIYEQKTQQKISIWNRTSVNSHLN